MFCLKTRLRSKGSFIICKATLKASRLHTEMLWSQSFEKVAAIMTVIERGFASTNITSSRLGSSCCRSKAKFPRWQTVRLQSGCRACSKSDWKPDCHWSTTHIVPAPSTMGGWYNHGMTNLWERTLHRLEDQLLPETRLPQFVLIGYPSLSWNLGKFQKPNPNTWRKLNRWRYLNVCQIPHRQAHICIYTHMTWMSSFCCEFQESIFNFFFQKNGQTWLVQDWAIISA